MTTRAELKLAKKKFDRIAKFKTVKGIRDFLNRQGIKGLPMSADSCPIANFINYNGKVRVYFTEWYIKDSSDDPPYGPPYGFKKIQNTKAMTEFIRRFDNGEYPELVE